MMEVPLPSAEQISILLFGFLLGVPVPYWFAQERVRGFTRAMLLRLPYEPPPGKETDEAMEEAVNDDVKS